MMNSMNFFNLNSTSTSSSLFGSTGGGNTTSSGFKSAVSTHAHEDEENENDDDGDRIMGNGSSASSHLKSNHATYNDRNNNTERMSHISAVGDEHGD